MELEFKRQDGSWHPCRITLSSDDPCSGIIISFENCKEEQIISNKEDCLAQLRFRSAFLQAGECSKIKEKDCVLALHDNNNDNNNNPSDLFFDAVVEKLNRVRHSDRLLCRCTSELRFLSPNIKNQTMKVPSNHIMRLSDKQIESHIAFKAFLESTTPRAELEFHDLSENELDLNFLLEKQVEEISKFADGVDCSNDFIKEVKDANQKGVKKKSKTNLQETNQLKGKNENRNTSFLSPLAARAALASLTVGSPELEIQAGFQFPVFETGLVLTFPDSENLDLEKSGSEKSSVDVPRRVTRSSGKRSLDRENEKIKSISNACISTDIIPGCEGNDAEIQTIKKKKIIPSKKQPTRSSPRKTRSQTNK